MKKSSIAAVAGALGVVYGDIGTSPLYAFRQFFSPTVGMLPDAAHVVGAVSLITWSLMIVVSIKYVGLVMRAHNNGEGGILSLLALAEPFLVSLGRNAPRLFALGIFGAALFYGDAIITPAISVLSAVEGMAILDPNVGIHAPLVACIILALLFAFQKNGSDHVGAWFGPVMFTWFVVMAVLGVLAVIRNPIVLQALDPTRGIALIVHEPRIAVATLATVVLALTGAEALYADMGHFGAGAVRVAWFAVVYPALALNYLGQGAVVLGNPLAVQNPFYLLAPSWALAPLVLLATAATVIASQAVITGAYSVTKQAIQLGLLPRLRIEYTSEKNPAQVYMPFVNWALCALVIAVTLGFGSSEALASAYATAVTGTMIVTTVIAAFVANRLWNWPWPRVALVFAVFLLLDMAFFGANLTKIDDGGWFPLAVGALVYVVLSTWRGGRARMLAALERDAMDPEHFCADLGRDLPRVPGTAVYMTSNPRIVPRSLLHNLGHNHVLHERILLLHVETARVPRIDPASRVTLKELSEGVYMVRARFGFLEHPDVPGVLARVRALGLKVYAEESSFFLGSDIVTPSRRSPFRAWRTRLFAWMMRTSVNATDFFRLPPHRVVLMGSQLPI
jgi:KUP system potassium uptake protein